MSDKDEKRPYDEQTLARVLEAAYVLQEHNREAEEKARQREKREMTPPENKPSAVTAALKQAKADKTAVRPSGPEDYAVVLAQIVETQRQIQAQHLEFDAAITMVAERTAEIARADGSGIAILEGVNVRYAAATAAMALPVGTEVLMERALCAASLRVGHVVRCADVNVEFLVDLEECRRRGIQAMIAAPVFVSGNVAGALELYYASSQAFVEQDVHTCQLMAGLIGEALAREQGLAPTNSAQEELSVGTALEVPAFLTEKASSKASPPKVVQPPKVVGTCDKCGSEIVEEEQFCGSCGLPVGFASTATAEVAVPQSKKMKAPSPAATTTDPPNVTFSAAISEYLNGRVPIAAENKESANEPAVSALQLRHEGTVLSGHIDGSSYAPPPELTVSEADSAANWGSAASARDFLEELAQGKKGSAVVRFLKARRGDIYLAIALVLIAIVIRWGIWSGHPVSATANPAAAASRRRPDADLPFFDRLLIKLGLAEAPDPPEYKGNPNTQVWVDVQTGLYYCPGADLYGKTTKGKLSSQRDAQMDQYEPAARKACD